MLKGQDNDLTLLKFQLDGADSLLNCKIIESYNDLIKYINLYVDSNTALEDRYHLHTAIYRLLSDDPINNSKFGIVDESLEGLNTHYKRESYLKLLDDLYKFNFVYQKEFLETGAPHKSSVITSSTIKSNYNISYSSPFYHFGLDYIESTIKSKPVDSDLRSETSFHYNKYLKLKSLEGRASKSISEKNYKRFGLEYRKKYEKYVDDCTLGSFNVNDTSKVNKCYKDRLVLNQLELKLRNLELKFLIINEQEVKNYKNVSKDLAESFNKCNCPTIIEPQDKDGDGYNVIVDCNDNLEKGGANFYPGAPIDCNNKWNWADCNCDGVKDVCCVDNDGDGFYESEGCDCNQDLDSEDILSKCDCDDDDITVHPGADIVCDNDYTDDNCDGITDTLQFQFGKEINLTSLDKIYPPYGLTRFGRDKSFYLYSGLIAGGLTSTVYHKLKSDKYYSMFESSETFRDQQDLFDIANANHKRFVISAAFTASVYLVSQFDINMRYRRYNDIRNEIQNRREDCAYIYEIKFSPFDISSANVGPSIKINF
jgi:hypothetical protein